jgi:hypothetical protein
VICRGRPFQSVAQITRCEDGCCDDDGLLAVLLAFFVLEFSLARMGGFAEDGDSILQQPASRCGGWCGLCGCGAA